ncbi:hypothetical protein K493DRAFT_44476 [Basidiobolus meristosporus CBS 931.73]|uniref:Uncharacterized protein n=1 Tax=Basidiobolus meristosporus CBS 931.73 TaxID=1314790 RepID=A0A1Y1Y412_9FUNG|nr:hypothetical protein K493DRAFT_44476 [Basidiobolus meristosporus CBS 931.73]|eukprot:ORX92324.1 hypothetical protein K493DRAFT_44476 [Basidiobolus meristosporus CBS 931.73]
MVVLQEYFLLNPFVRSKYKLVRWPSGLRRCVQVAVSSEAWVRTPPSSSILLLACTKMIRGNITMLTVIGQSVNLESLYYQSQSGNPARHSL